MKVSNLIQKRIIIFLVAVIVFYGSLVFFMDLTKIDIDFDKFGWEYYFLIFPLTLNGIFITGVRFHFLLKKLEIKMKFFESMILYISGLSLSFTPGGSGAIIKSYFLKKKVGKSISETAPIIIYEKWLEFFVIVLLTGFLLFFYNFLASQIVFGIGLILIVISFILFKKPQGLKLLNKLFSKIKPFKKVIIGIEEFSTTSKELTNLRTTLSMLSLTILARVNGFIVIFLIFQSFKIDYDFFLVSQIFNTAALMGILSFIPGGIIVTESGLLGLLLNQGLSFDLASLLVIVIRFVSLWFVTIVGFIGLKLMLKKYGKE